MIRKYRNRLMAYILLVSMLLSQFTPLTAEAGAADISAENVIEIGTAEELIQLSEMSKTDSFEGKVIKLTNDIVFNEGLLDSEYKLALDNPVQWVPIAQKSTFRGEFDGQGHTITGLFADGRADASYANSNL